MARKNNPDTDERAPSRVYKASDVHKRRVNRKGEPAKGAEAPGKAAEDSPAEVPARASRQAAVIAPEFGKRTPASREADDRWFAAMRESGFQQDAISDEAAARPQVAEMPAEQAESAAPAEPAIPDTPAEPVKPADPIEQPVRAKPAEPAQQAEPPASDEPAADDEPAPKRPSPIQRLSSILPENKRARIGLVVGAVVLVAAIIVASLYVWNRWYRFDDHADMQGEWYVVGTTVPVVIDEASIRLTDDVTYLYEIDAHDKTIRYTFGPMEGQGRYWLSDDRRYLVITDGDEFTGSSTAVDDLLHAFSDMGSTVLGAGPTLPQGEGVIAFSRTPNFCALVRDRVAASAKAATEEKARQEEERRAAEEAAAWAEEYYYYYYEEEPAEEIPAEETPAGEPMEGEASAEEPMEGEQDAL